MGYNETAIMLEVRESERVTETVAYLARISRPPRFHGDDTRRIMEPR